MRSAGTEGKLGDEMSGENVSVEYAVRCRDGDLDYHQRADLTLELARSAHYALDHVADGHWRCSPHTIVQRTVSDWAPVAGCSQCRQRLSSQEDDAHNHGICSACWSEAAAEQESQR